MWVHVGVILTVISQCATLFYPVPEEIAQSAKCLLGDHEDLCQKPGTWFVSVSPRCRQKQLPGACLQDNLSESESVPYSTRDPIRKLSSK